MLDRADDLDGVFGVADGIQRDFGDRFESLFSQSRRQRREIEVIAGHQRDEIGE